MSETTKILISAICKNNELCSKMHPQQKVQHKTIKKSGHVAIQKEITATSSATL